MVKRSMRGQVAVVGIGETEYYKHGGSPDPEFVLTLKAILAAADDAGIDATDIDGFSSYSDDRNAGVRLASALGTKELRFSTMQWGGGGGGGSGAVANAAAAIHAGLADTVVVYRGLAQGQFARFGRGAAVPAVAGDAALRVPYGIMAPAQIYSFRVMRFMHDHGVKQDALRAIALASYHHAQTNPRAVMYGRPLTEERYDESRWITEPFHLYDCCQENDGAAALILTSAERAKDLPQKPAYILAAQAGGSHRSDAPGLNSPTLAGSNFQTVAPRLWDLAEVGPQDVDVVQCYENFTGGVLMSLVEHGFVGVDEIAEKVTLDNLRYDGGSLPLNTSGGNLAECYMHGLELITEAVRQIRGTAPNQLADVKIASVASGPMVTPVSSSVYGSEAAL